MNNFETFDPMKVPELKDLFRELEEKTSFTSQNTNPGEKMEEYIHTSLRPYIELFEQFINDIEEDMRSSRLNRKRGRYNHYF
jgi:HEPN domain-containing protein